MKIKVTEKERRIIYNFEAMPLFITLQRTFMVYGNLKFEEEIEEVKTIFGKKKRKSIYMINCDMKFSDDVEEEMFNVTDEAKEKYLKEFNLSGLRENYLEVKKRYRVLQKFIIKSNEKTYLSKINKTKKKNRK